MYWVAWRSSRAGGQLFDGDGQGARPAFEMAAISGQTGHWPTPYAGRSRRLPNRADLDLMHRALRVEYLFLSFTGGRNAGFRNGLVSRTLPSFW
jgi:hypothetical protein